MSKVKVALVGCGGMANGVHYPSLADFKDVEITGICDLSPERLKETADRFKVKARFSDYRKMIDEVASDGVYVIMGPHLLYDMAAYALDKGKHVFIEKPPGITTEQTRQLSLKAKAKNLVTMCGFNRRFIPMLMKAKEKVEAVGPLTQITVTYLKAHSQATPFLYYNGASDILRCDTIHAVDMLRWLGGGKVAAVASVVRQLDTDHDNSYNAIVRFDNGAVGFLNGNWRVARRFFSVEIHCNGASAFIEGNNEDDKARIYREGEKEPEVLKIHDVAESTEFARYYGYYQENRHFIDCIQSGKQPITNFEDATLSMQLCDDILSCQI